MKYPEITKHNLDAWEGRTYGYIIHGMMHENPDIQYGILMRKADQLTVRLFRALKRDMRKKK